tara:strand:+ start:2119 stop:2415 length:297 start_codon:yes stop_codon:yes gene_type:complete
MDIKIKAKEIMVKDIQKINLSASQKISDIKDKDKVQFKCNNITYPKKKYQIMKKPSYLVKNSYDDYDVTYIGNIDKNEEDNYDITYIGFVCNIENISQ